MGAKPLFMVHTIWFNILSWVQFLIQSPGYTVYMLYDNDYMSCTCSHIATMWQCPVGRYAQKIIKVSGLSMAGLPRYHGINHGGQMAVLIFLPPSSGGGISHNPILDSAVLSLLNHLLWLARSYLLNLCQEFLFSAEFQAHISTSLLDISTWMSYRNHGLNG